MLLRHLRLLSPLPCPVACCRACRYSETKEIKQVQPAMLRATKSGTASSFPTGDGDGQNQWQSIHARATNLSSPAGAQGMRQLIVLPTQATPSICNLSRCRGQVQEPLRCLRRRGRTGTLCGRVIPYLVAASSGQALGKTRVLAEKLRGGCSWIAEKGIAYPLRWRILLRMRRFLRPTLRRPFFFLRPAIGSSQ